jgi:heterodisulfide reductase subunit C
MTDGKKHEGVDEVEKLGYEVVQAIQLCRRCRMCVGMCPTYEGWLSESSMGRLAAINLYFKYGLGNANELSRLLFQCTTCRRCQERCTHVSVAVKPTDVIVKARQALVKMGSKGEERNHE